MVGRAVLFLDFDGPMVPMDSWSLDMKRINRCLPFDKKAVATVLRILQETDTKLVISSSWRKIGYEQISSVLEKEGISRDHLHKDWGLDYDPSVGMGGRADLIKKWLDEHPDTEHYVALDDFPLELPNLVKVSTFTGMSETDHTKLLSLFNLN